jgi:alkaline phosphatase D
VNAIAQHARHRAVVLTGDNHSNWVTDIRTDGPRGASVCTEFLGTSISSGGDGSERSSFFNDAVAAENPHVKWQNNRRGYMVCEVTPEHWRTEFRTVAFVSKPDAPVETPTRWRVTHGQPGVERE